MSDINFAAAKLRADRKKRVYYRICVLLAAAVVFCTVYALILPAVTQSSDYIVNKSSEYSNLTVDGEEIDAIKWTVDIELKEDGAAYYADSLGDGLEYVSSRGIEMSAYTEDGIGSEFYYNIQGCGDNELDALALNDEANTFYINLSSQTGESQSLAEYSGMKFVKYTLVYYTYFDDESETGVFESESRLLDEDFGEISKCVGEYSFSSENEAAAVDDTGSGETTTSLSADSLDGQTFVIANFSSAGSYALTNARTGQNSGNYLAKAPVEIASYDSDGIPILTEDTSYGYGAPIAEWTFDKVEGTTNQYYIYTTTNHIDADGNYEEGTYYLYMGINTWQVSANAKTASELTDVYKFTVEEGTGEYAGTFTIRTSTSGNSGYRYLTASLSNAYFANEVQSKDSGRRYMTLCRAPEEASALDGKDFAIVSLNVYSTEGEVLATKPNHALSSTEYSTGDMDSSKLSSNPTSALKGTEINLSGTRWDTETGLKLGTVSAKEAGNRLTTWKFIHISGTSNKYILQDTKTGKYLWLNNEQCSDTVRPSSNSAATVTDTISANNIITISIGDENSYVAGSGTHEGQVVLWAYGDNNGDKSSLDNEGYSEKGNAYIALRWYGTYSDGSLDYFTTGSVGAYSYGNLNAMTLCEIEKAEIDVSASFYGLTQEQIDSILGTSESPNFSVPVRYADSEDNECEMNVVSSDGVYEYRGNSSGTTYDWTYHSYTGESYVFSEDAYSLDGYLVSTRVTQTYVDDEGNVVTESSWASSTEELENLIIGGTTTSITFENFYTPVSTGALSILKTSSTDGAQLNGAVFTLTEKVDAGSTEDANVFTATSDNTGLALFSALPTGTYTLEETTAPIGYKTCETTWTIVVEATTEEASQNITVTVYENDKEGNPIIPDSTNPVYFKTITPTGEGTETTVTIEQGNYPITNERDGETLIVKKTFTGLTAAQMDAIAKASTDSYTGYTVNLTNDANGSDYVSMQLSLSEAVRSGSSVAGYTFTWTLPNLPRTTADEAQSDIIYTLTELNYESTDYADVLISASLEDGTSVGVTFSTADDGSETATIQSSLTDQSSISLTNHYTKTFSLHLYKTAADTGETLSNVTFDVYGPYGQSTHIKDTYSYVDEDGETQILYWVAQITTDENGLAVLDDLLLTTYGGNTYTYALVEQDAPDGYVEADPVVFTAKTSSSVENGEPGTYTQGIYTTTVIDSKIYRSDTFSFLKADGDTNALLSDAGFALYELTCTDSSHDHSADLLTVDKDGNLTDSAQSACWTQIAADTSEADGVIELYAQDLTEDADEVYRLVEYASPDGYSHPEGQWIIAWDTTVTPNRMTVTGTVGSPPSFTAVGNAADGADYSYETETKTLSEVTFSSYVKVTYNADGTDYAVTAVDNGDGTYSYSYTVDETQVALTGDEEVTVKTYHYMVYNYASYELPETGGSGAAECLIIGSVMMAASFGVYVYNYFKRKGRGETN